MGNNAVKQHFETAQRTGVLKISQKRLKVGYKTVEKEFRHFIVIFFCRSFHPSCESFPTSSALLTYRKTIS